MAANNHFDNNRPVHLGFRDAYYERAIVLLLEKRELQQCELAIDEYERILFLLRSARKHARLAIRRDAGSESDRLFCDFVNVLAGNVKAVLSMLNLRRMVENAEGFFLSSEEINQASVVLQAEEYERRAHDIVRCVHNTLGLARTAFERLKEENRRQFSAEEQERYGRASGHLRDLLKQAAGVAPHHAHNVLP